MWVEYIQEPSAQTAASSVTFRPWKGSRSISNCFFFFICLNIFQFYKTGELWIRKNECLFFFDIPHVLLVRMTDTDCVSFCCRWKKTSLPSLWQSVQNLFPFTLLTTNSNNLVEHFTSHLPNDVCFWFFKSHCRNIVTFICPEWTIVLFIAAVTWKMHHLTKTIPHVYLLLIKKAQLNQSSREKKVLPLDSWIFTDSQWRCVQAHFTTRMFWATGEFYVTSTAKRLTSSCFLGRSECRANIAEVTMFQSWL